MMKRYFLVGFAAASVTAGLMLLGQAIVSADEGQGKTPTVVSHTFVTADGYPLQPDTAAPNWKSLSDDLGIWIVKSDQFRLQGRLYTRVGARWVPVSVDGSREIYGVMPVR